MHTTEHRSSASTRSVRIALDRGQELQGDLALPVNTRGVVLFAHGSGSSRRSGRNRQVATLLQRASLGTLLFDLLTEHEEEAEQLTRHLRFDIPLLTERLIVATEWLSCEIGRALPLGYFGASTGAAAALRAAALRPSRIGAVVSRGGRPDLAAELLRDVSAPTLLIVGGVDEAVLELNREALRALRTEKALEIIPGASHLFEERGALAKVGMLATRWFTHHLT